MIVTLIRCCGASLLAAGILATLWAPGWAAGASFLPLDKMPEPMEGAWRLGPLRVRPLLQLRDLGYDSNVFLSEEGQEEGDFTCRLAGGLRGQVLFGNRGVVGFEADSEYVAFATTSSQNYLNGMVDARGDLVLHRLSLFAGGHWSSSMERATSEFDERTRLRFASAFAGAGWRTSNRTSVAGSVSEQQYRYSDADVPGLDESLNRTERTLAVRGVYRAFARSSVFIELSRSRMLFDDGPEEADPQSSAQTYSRDSEQRSFMPGISFDPTAPVSGGLKAGRAVFDATDQGKPDFRGLLGEAEVAFRLSDRWRLAGTWERDVSFSIFENNLYFEQRRRGAKFERSLGDRYALEAGGEFEQLDWPERDTSALPGQFTDNGEPVRTCDLTGLDCSILRRDTIRSYFIGGRMRVWRRSDLSVRLGYRHRSSNIPGESDRQVLLTTGTGF